MVLFSLSKTFFPHTILVFSGNDKFCNDIDLTFLPAMQFYARGIWCIWHSNIVKLLLYSQGMFFDVIKKDNRRNQNLSMVLSRRHKLEVKVMLATVVADVFFLCTPCSCMLQIPPSCCKTLLLEAATLWTDSSNTPITLRFCLPMKNNEKWKVEATPATAQSPSFVLVT